MKQSTKMAALRKQKRDQFITNWVLNHPFRLVDTFVKIRGSKDEWVVLGAFPQQEAMTIENKFTCELKVVKFSRLTHFFSRTFNTYLAIKDPTTR